MFYIVGENTLLDAHKVFDVRTNTVTFINDNTIKEMLNIDGNYIINGRLNGDEIEFYEFMNHRVISNETFFVFIGSLSLHREVYGKRCKLLGV